MVAQQTNAEHIAGLVNHLEMAKETLKEALQQEREAARDVTLARNRVRDYQKKLNEALVPLELDAEH